MVALEVSKEKLVNPENPVEGETNLSNERKAGLTLNVLRFFTGIAAFLSLVWSAFVSVWVALVLLLSIKFDFSDGVNSTTVFISGFINLIMTYLSYGLIWITLVSGSDTDPCPPRFWNFLPNPKFIFIWLYSGLMNFVYHLIQFYFSPNSSYFTDFTEFVTFLLVYYIILLTVSVHLAVLRCKRPACFQN